jgi:hypothetical protein
VNPFARKGAEHPAWKGGVHFTEGYLRTYHPEHPWPRKGGYIREHIRVMELHLGRRLRPNELVHHKDHNKLNNDLANLELLERGAHSRLHRAEDLAERPEVFRRRRDAAGRFAKAAS